MNSDDLCLMAHEDSTKGPDSPIEVTIEHLINGPKEVLKDILLNLLKNEEQSTLGMNSLRNEISEFKIREESLLQKLDVLQSDLESQIEKSKTVFELKVKALTTGHDSKVRALIDDNISLKRKLTSLNCSKDWEMQIS